MRWCLRLQYPEMNIDFLYRRSLCGHFASFDCLAIHSSHKVLLHRTTYNMHGIRRPICGIFECSLYVHCIHTFHENLHAVQCALHVMHSTQHTKDLVPHLLFHSDYHIYISKHNVNWRNIWVMSWQNSKNKQNRTISWCAATRAMHPCRTNSNDIIHIAQTCENVV